MDRREALSRVAIIFGGTIIGMEAFLSGCNTSTAPKEGLFSVDDIAFLDEVGETILPKTTTPGAKDAQVGQFMKVIVTDCYKPEDQKIFTDGIEKLNKASKDKYKDDFMTITPQQRNELLNGLDKEATAYAKSKKPEDANHYFTMMKQLTVWGYFTSEPGATQALRYVPVPGRYDGCIDYKKGDKAWALS